MQYSGYSCIYLKERYIIVKIHLYLFNNLDLAISFFDTGVSRQRLRFYKRSLIL